MQLSKNDITIFFMQKGWRKLRTDRYVNFVTQKKKKGQQEQGRTSSSTNQDNTLNVSFIDHPYYFLIN